MQPHEEIMAIAAAAVFVDENFEDQIDKAGNLCRDLGGTEDEIEAMRQMQREWLQQYRAGLGASLVGACMKALL